ncbi:MAG TPA: tyrosine-type recombinase/integrase [Aquella sp.]|nr:tyrosine-type recombinase/integrase [Aquella sp.]
MYKIPDFIGPFKDILPNFINYQRSLGYDYQKATVLKFKELDTFLFKHGYSKIEMTQEMYDLWIAKRSNETNTNRGRRCSTFTMLAKYLTSSGYNNIFVPPPNNRMWKSNFAPYIFSHDEITNIFKVAGKIDNSTHVATSTFVVMLAVLYTCGLRISELLNIKLQNINFTTGAIQILNSKNHTNRLIVASDSLREQLTEYHLKCTYPVNVEYFFRTTNGMQVPYSTFSTLYHKTLALAQIHKKDDCRYKYPRIHDMRHTFAVHSLEKMVSDGYDTYTLLPLLSKFLGHRHINETEYYLRFTEENYDSVKALTNNIYQGVFPKVEQ